MNQLDRTWKEFLDFKNSAILANICNYDDRSLFIADCYNSKYFSEALSNIIRLYSVVGTSDDRFDSVKSYSSSFCSVLTKLFLAINPLKEVKHTAVEMHYIHEIYCRSGMPRDVLCFLLEIIDCEIGEKIEFIETISLGRRLLNCDIEFYGTFLFDGNFIATRVNGLLVFFISVQSPVDGFYIPALNALIVGDGCKFEIASRLEKFIRWSVLNSQYFLQCCKTPGTSEIYQIIRDKRPYHVVADEEMGNFFLKTNGKFFKKCYLKRSTFIEQTESKVIDELEHGIAHSKDLIFSFHYRLSENNISEEFVLHLKNSACTMYSDVLNIQSSRRHFWIGISGGEKRRWLEEEDSLVRTILLIKSQVNNPVFVFEGWTLTNYPTDSDRVQIAKFEEMLKSISFRASLDSSDMVNLIGSQILLKIYYSMQCDFFISCAGTPAMWPSRICQLPGVVHNSTRMINRVDNTLHLDGVVKIPNSYITDINEQGDNIRWDRYSYSISAENFISVSFPLFKREDFNIAGFRDAYPKLIDFGKIGGKSLYESAAAYVSEKLSNYRNIQHLLRSTSFFSNSNVHILADISKCFRVIDCNASIDSKIIFITFGTVSSNIDHIPFGYPFLNNSGFKHIHVAQYKGTSYQNLTLEIFFEHFKSLLDPETVIFTYGTSLGGYAALYFSSVIKAFPIAGSPRLPLHPINRKYEGRLFNADDHWNEIDYKHSNLSDVSERKMAPLIFVDRQDELYSNFLDSFIIPAYDKIYEFDIPGSKHGSLYALSKKGILKKMILEYVDFVCGNSSFDKVESVISEGFYVK